MCFGFVQACARIIYETGQHKICLIFRNINSNGVHVRKLKTLVIISRFDTSASGIVIDLNTRLLGPGLFESRCRAHMPIAIVGL